MIIILTFIAFTGLVALISWYKTKEENLSTKEGYFLAGRGLTGLVIAGSLEMTNLSTEQLVGQAGQSYSTNMGAMSWSVNASIALLALALIFLPKYLKAGITTIPEFLEVRFDRTTKQIISFLFLLGYMLTYLPTVLYSGALAFNQIFHLDELFGITIARPGYLNPCYTYGPPPRHCSKGWPKSPASASNPHSGPQCPVRTKPQNIPAQSETRPVYRHRIPCG